MSVLFRREPTGSAGGQRPDDHVSTERSNAAETSAIQKIIEQRLVTAEFQPIVRIDTGEIVAFESFARGPVDSPLSTPRAMFRAAAAAGLTGELDLIAANAAFAAARFSPQLDALTFFVNIDPSGLRQPRSEELQAQADEAMSRVRVVFELPEQALVDDPVGTIIAAEQLRQLGAQVAIDNVGASAQALALLPFVRPDVIKLAPMLVSSPTQRIAPVVAKLASYTDPAGGLLIAQGIEQDEQRTSAVGMGARLGQGYLFGRPVTVPVTPQEPAEPLRVHHPQDPSDAADTPFALLSAHQAAAPVAHSMFEALAQHLLERVEAWTEPFVLAIVTNGPGFLNAGRSPRLRTLGRKTSLMLVFTTNAELPSTKEMTVKTLDNGDPLREEMALLALSPYAGAMLASRKSGTETYDCLVSYDRDPVSAGIRALLRRCVPTDQQR